MGRSKLLSAVPGCHFGFWHLSCICICLISRTLTCPFRFAFSSNTSVIHYRSQNSWVWSGDRTKYDHPISRGSIMLRLRLTSPYQTLLTLRLQPATPSSFRCSGCLGNKESGSTVEAVTGYPEWPMREGIKVISR